MRIVLVTGGFDPLHSGHIAYFKEARRLGDKLIVGLNSDKWLTSKKGQPFLPFVERLEIVRNLKIVDSVIDVEFDDSDGSSRAAISAVREMYPSDNIVFANGGDRTMENIPEMDITDSNVTFAFGVGGHKKKNSSSLLLENWKYPKIQRPWGYYRVIHTVDGTKVKELTIEPGQQLSMQRHKFRSEQWLVTEGRAIVNRQLNSGYVLPPVELKMHDMLNIEATEWHQLTNPFDTPVKIVEIQYGEQCLEEDIERL